MLRLNIMYAYLRRRVYLRKIRLHLVAEEQIVERAERAVLFYLVYGHFLAVHRQFNKASPAVKLVGADLSDIFGTTVWTFHPTSPYPFTELMAFSRRCSLIGGTITACSPIAISAVQGSHLRPSIKSDTKPSDISSPSIVLPCSCSK